MNVIAYLRDSGGPSQKYSTDQQAHYVQAYCLNNGYTLTHLFRETKSGTTDQRPEFQRMMRHLERHAASTHAVILWDYSRFSRNIDDAEWYRLKIRRMGVDIISLNDEIPDGPIGRIVEFMLDVSNQMFIDSLRKNIKRGQESVTRRGGKLGPVPVGYRRTHIPDGTHRSGKPRTITHWEPDPETAPRVQKAFRMYSQGATLAAIHRATNLYASRGSYVPMLRNRAYIGEYKWGDYVDPAGLEPLVDEKTYADVQKRIQSRKPAPTPRKTSPYLLTGLLRCGGCGYHLSTHTQTQPRKKHRVATYRYYVCHNCDPTYYIPKLALENAILTHLQAVVLDNTIIASITDEYRTRYDELTTQYNVRRRQLQNEIANKRSHIANMIQAIQGGNYGGNALVDAMEATEAELAALEHERDRLFPPARPDTLDASQIAMHIEHILQEIAKNDYPTARTILRGFVDHITVYRQGKIVTGEMKIVLSKDFGAIAQKTLDNTHPAQIVIEYTFRLQEKSA